MATLDVRISELPAAIAPAETDQYEINQGGTSKRITLSLIRPRHPGIRNSTAFFASYYTASSQLAASTSSAAVAANRIYYAVFAGFGGAIFNRLGIEVTTGAAGLARLGMFSPDRTGSNAGNPGALILDAGTVDTTSNAIVEAALTDMTCPDLFWVGAVFNATPTCRTVGGGENTLIGDSAPGNTTPGRGVRGTFTFGTLPASAPAPTTYDAATPVFGLRYV